MRSFLIILILSFSASLRAAAQELELLTRTEIVVPEVVVANKKHLQPAGGIIRVGVWGPAQPPIMVDNDLHVFEGIAADYLDAVRRMLNIRVQVLYFSGQNEMSAALYSGAIHMAAIYNPDLLDLNPPLIYTTPYLLDYSVMVQKQNHSGDNKDLTGKIIAWAGSKKTGEKLQQDYPAAILQQHNTYAHALAATAFAQADATWGNAATLEYLLRYGYDEELLMSPGRTLSNLNISFGVSPHYPELAEALNMALRMIPLAGRLRIANQWQLQSHYVMKANPLALNPEEDSWLRLHPHLSALMPIAAAPLLFLDQQGSYQGIAKEILDLVAKRAGINVVPMQQPDSAHTAIAEESDFSPAVLIDEQSKASRIYSRPYIVSPWVLVQPVGTPNIVEVSSQKKRRLLLLNHTQLQRYLSQKWPDIQLNSHFSAAEALVQLKDGKVDGVVLPKLHADYFLHHYYPGQLHIMQVMGEQPARIGMSANAANAPLIQIINKALLDIPPETIEPLISRWHSLPHVSRTISWHDYKEVMIKVAVPAGIIILICLIWNRHLQRVVRQRTSAEHALKNQLTFTNTLFNESPVVMYVRDKQARLIHCNKAYLDFLHVSLEEVIGKGTEVYRHLLDEPFLAELEEEHAATLRLGIARTRDLELQFRGRSIHVFHWALPFRDRLGAIVGVIGGWLDVTERHELLLALSAAKEEADTANRSKSQFLASMSHEIRTPLHAIIGLLEIEIRQKPAPEIGNNILVAYESANALLSLIGDILDLSRIESGIHQPKPEPCHLPQRVEQVINLFRNQAESKSIELRHQIDITHPCVMLDAMMFTQIFSNLLSNAIKFTDQGYVSVILYQGSVDTETQRGEFVLDIEDSGCGLNKAQQQAIFEPFVQAGNSQRQLLGTGLGLSICRKLATLLAGDVLVESQPGKGSVFRFYFLAPLTNATETYKQPPQRQPFQQPLRVMIIDDHAPNRLLLGQQLNYAGHKALLLESAIQALAIWRQNPDEFDLIISDCNLPDMDGFAFTRQLRALEAELQRRPVLIYGLTASAEREIIQRCLDAGMDDCMFKPLNVDALMRYLSKTEHQNNPQPEPENLIAPDQNEAFIPCPLLQELAERDRPGCLSFIDSVITSNNEIVAEITASHDCERLSHLGHKMKGGARLINASAVEKLAKALEEKPASSQELALIKAQLTKEIRCLESGLQQFKKRIAV